MTDENATTYDAVSAHVAASTQHVSASDSGVESPRSNDSAELTYRVSRFANPSRVSISLVGGAEGSMIAIDVASASPMGALASIAVSRTVAGAAASRSRAGRHSGMARDAKLAARRFARGRRTARARARERCARRGVSRDCSSPTSKRPFIKNRTSTARAASRRIREASFPGASPFALRRSELNNARRERPLKRESRKKTRVRQRFGSDFESVSSRKIQSRRSSSIVDGVRSILGDVKRFTRRAFGVLARRARAVVTRVFSIGFESSHARHRFHQARVMLVPRHDRRCRA